MRMKWLWQVGQIISIAIIAIPLPTFDKSYFSLSFTLVDYPLAIPYTIASRYYRSWFHSNATIK